jgi:hypothetical protein
MDKIDEIDYKGLKMKKNFLLFTFCFLLFACQTRQRGFIFPEDLDAKVAEIKTVSQLESEFGSPSVKTVHGDKIWIYYGMDEVYRGPFPYGYKNKTALLVWVDGGKVTQTKILHDDDLPRVRPARGETEIPAAIELNAFQELINNIGRFSPAGLGQ